MSSGATGPSLEHIGRQAYLAGRLPHTLSSFIALERFPKRLQPPIVMPNMGVSEREARDIAAYLYARE